MESSLQSKNIMIWLKKIVVFIITWEARAILARYQPKIIAVTGSVGKTSAKDAIFAALSEWEYVRKSEKSFNSEIGVPLTILGSENAWTNPIKWASNIIKALFLIIFGGKYPHWLILEVGADRPGDIKKIASWLRPDIVVLTGVPEMPAHIEYFGSHEKVLEEKRALAYALKRGGTLILNGDDIYLKNFRMEYEGDSFAYGMESHNNFAATHVGIIYERLPANGSAKGKVAQDSKTSFAMPLGMSFRMVHKGSSLPVSIYKSLGAPRIYAALASFAVGNVLGLDYVTIADALSKWDPQPGRMRILHGINGSVIIDDTYNSSPVAALSALDTIGTIKNVGRRIGVLGDMLELGKVSREAHRRVGERAAEICALLLTVGIRARDIGEAALDSGLSENNIREYESKESARAGEELKKELREGDVVLVKGSQSVRMERAVFQIMSEPQNARELLVRQESEWQNR